MSKETNSEFLDRVAVQKDNDLCNAIFRILSNQSILCQASFTYDPVPRLVVVFTGASLTDVRALVEGSIPADELKRAGDIHYVENSNYDSRISIFDGVLDSDNQCDSIAPEARPIKGLNLERDKVVTIAQLRNLTERFLETRLYLVPNVKWHVRAALTMLAKLER
jgi:hypothetical protein